MTEFIGLAYFAEIPVTIINVQRGGPSTGMPTRTQQADLLSCAYASHGDTKHVLLFPEDPRECFDFAAASLDLADRLQTPIFVMTDLDIGMNHRLCEPLAWDDSRTYDRGKVMTADELEAGKDFGRYLDVDGDGIPYRTLPGTHPSKGAYFTRGTTRDPYARYSEAGPDYLYNVERLLKKFETAKELVPQPVLRKAAREARFGAIFYGSTSPAMAEAFDALQAQGVQLDTLARARVPVQRRGRPLHRRARDRVRDRAEPRRAAAHDADQRAGDRSGAARCRSSTTTARRSPRASSSARSCSGCAPPTSSRSPRGRGRRHEPTRAATCPAISAISKERHAIARASNRDDLSRQAQAAPPDPAAQQARLHAARLRRQDLDPVRRLRPRLDLGGAGPGLLGARHRAAPRRQAVGHRLLVEDARLLPRRLARLQHRARPHAVGADRREPREPRAAVPRRQRRRRLGVDRPRPVRACDAARRQHDLHRREQRRLRPDQGPVLGDRRPGQQEQEGRGQQRHRDRPRRDGAAARRELRRRAASRATRSSWCR